MYPTEEDVKEAIGRFQSHLKFYGINPLVENVRKDMPEGTMYITTLTAHNGFRREKLATQGTSDVSQDIALLAALELFYSKMREQYDDRKPD